MATYSSFETGLRAERATDIGEQDLRPHFHPDGRESQVSQSPLPWKPAIETVSADHGSGSRMRRIITREQGRALETISHAVDYLQDCHVYEGPEEELINIASPATEAIQILVAIRRELLNSLPLRETFSQRLWKAIFHRRSRRQFPHISQNSSSPVVRLSSR